MMSKTLYNMYDDYIGMHVVSHVLNALWNMYPSICHYSCRALISSYAMRYLPKYFAYSSLISDFINNRIE